jgi:hypothetical protein
MPVTSVPPYENFSLIKNNILHQSKTTKITSKIEISEVCDLYVTLVISRTWGMRLNATKCYKMSIHRSKDSYTHHYSLDNHILEQVENNPYVGVLISKDLKWSTHITALSDRLFQSLIVLGE